MSEVYLLARASSPERAPYWGWGGAHGPRSRLAKHNAGTCGCRDKRRCAAGWPWWLAATGGPFPAGCGGLVARLGLRR